MELTVVYDNECPCQKWIMRKCNIGQKYLCGIVDFRDEVMKRNLKQADYSMQPWVIALEKDQRNVDERKRMGNSRIIPSDTFRQLNLSEYIMLSSLLKKAKFKYNKKKDEFIRLNNTI